MLVGVECADIAFGDESQILEKDQGMVRLELLVQGRSSLRDGTQKMGQKVQESTALKESRCCSIECRSVKGRGDNLRGCPELIRRRFPF